MGAAFLSLTEPRRLLWTRLFSKHKTQHPQLRRVLLRQRCGLITMESQASGLDSLCLNWASIQGSRRVTDSP